MLLQSRDGAGVKIQLPAVAFQQSGRQDHEAHAHGGGDGLGEGVHVNDPPAAVDALQGGDGTAGEAELAVVVVLDDDAVGLLRPAQQRLPPANGGDGAGGIVVGRGDVDHVGPGGPQSGRVHALPVQRHRHTGGTAFAVNLPNLGIAGVLHGKNRLLAQELRQQQIEVFRAGAHHDLLR